MGRVRAFLDPLLRRATAIVEADYAFGWIAQVGHDETNPGEQLPLVPLHFSHYSPGQVPTLGLIGKVVVGDDRLPGWPFIRTLQQRLDVLLNHLIGGKPDGVPDLFLFQILV